MAEYQGNSQEGLALLAEAARIGNNALNEWYASINRYRGLNFWWQKTYPQWGKRLDNYYSIVYQAAKGVVSLDYLKLKSREMSKQASDIIGDYLKAGLPEPTFEELVEYARVIFNAEEIKTDDQPNSGENHASNREGEED